MPSQKFYSHEEYVRSIYMAMDDFSHVLSFYRNNHIDYHVCRFIESDELDFLRKIVEDIQDYKKFIIKLTESYNLLRESVEAYAPFSDDEVNSGDNYIFNLKSEMVKEDEACQENLVFSYDYNDFKGHIHQAMYGFEKHIEVFTHDTPLLEKWFKRFLRGADEFDGEECLNAMVNVSYGLIEPLDGLCDVYERVLDTIADHEAVADYVYVKKEKQ